MLKLKESSLLFSEKESVPLPPPVPNQKTEEGVTIWEDIYLAPAPPMYRPFVAMEEAENDLKKNPAAARARSKAGLCYRT